MKPQFKYTIRENDVGKGFIDMGTCTECGRKNSPIMVMDFMGNIQKQDVGKRIYELLNDAGDSSYYGVENNEQRDKREASKQ